MAADRFEAIWKRVIGLCVRHLPWSAIVDFRAREWPSLHESVIPDRPYAADHSELSNQAFTSFSVRLGSRLVEMTYFPSSGFWKSHGQEMAANNWQTVIEFSPVGGKLLRGEDKLEALAMEAFTWLNDAIEVEVDHDANANAQAV